MTVPPLRIRRPFDLGLAPGDSGLQDARSGGGVNQTMSKLIRDQQTDVAPASVYGGSGLWQGNVPISSGGPTWGSGPHYVGTPGWWIVTAWIKVAGSGLVGTASLFVGDTGIATSDLGEEREVDNVSSVTVSGSWVCSGPFASADGGYVIGGWTETAGTTATVRLAWRGIRLRDL